MCEVSRTTRVASKNVHILTILEFDEIQRGIYISRDDSNDEVCFIIRDLEKLSILIEITILPIYIKFSFLGVSHE